MDRKMIRERLIANYGEMVSITEVSRFIGCTRQTARTVLSGYSYLDTGKSKKYTADDVARAICERSTR
jgi:hypothetical protein